MELTTIEKETIGRLECATKTQDLTFMDGVLATWGIFDQILYKHLAGEKGPEGFSYLAAINDDVTDLLLNGLLERGYFLDRRDALLAHFGINPNLESVTPISTLPKPSQTLHRAVSDEEFQAFYTTITRAIDGLESSHQSIVRSPTYPPSKKQD